MLKSGTRVVEVKTATGITTRAIHRVSPLPTMDEQIQVVEKRAASDDGGFGPVRPPTKKRVVLPVGDTWHERNKQATGVYLRFLLTCLVLCAGITPGRCGFNVTKLS